MKESKFQKQVKKQLESQAAFIVNVHGHGFQKAGLPDLFVIHKDWKGFLELKVEKGQASALQRVVAAKIELRGMPVYVLRCVEVSGHGFKPVHCEYTLENFEGKIIKTDHSLDCLLLNLKELEMAKSLTEMEAELGGETKRMKQSGFDAVHRENYGEDNGKRN